MLLSRAGVLTIQPGTGYALYIVATAGALTQTLRNSVAPLALNAPLATSFLLTASTGVSLSPAASYGVSNQWFQPVTYYNAASGNWANAPSPGSPHGFAGSLGYVIASCAPPRLCRKPSATSPPRGSWGFRRRRLSGVIFCPTS